MNANQCVKDNLTQFHVPQKTLFVSLPLVLFLLDLVFSLFYILSIKKQLLIRSDHPCCAVPI